MASSTRPKAPSDFEVHQDSIDAPSDCAASAPLINSATDEEQKASVLGEVPVHRVRNFNYPEALNTAASELDKCRVDRSAKENHELAIGKARGLKGRPSLEKTTFLAPLSMTQEELIKPHALAIAHGQLESHQEQLRKHDAGQFDWVLSVPASAYSPGGQFANLAPDIGTDWQPGSDRLHFGCTLLSRQAADSDLLGDGGEADTYPLLATQLETRDTHGLKAESIPEEVGDMSTIELRQPSITGASETGTTLITFVGSPEANSADRGGPRDSSNLARDEKKADVICFESTTRSARIQYSGEGLDKLEDGVEALKLERTISGDAHETHPFGNHAKQRAERSAGLVMARSPPRTGSSTLRARAAERSREVRKSTSMTFFKKDGEYTTNLPSSKKVVRPSSLLPPKPPSKSSKPLTKPTFELPGDAVARRLKEQRQARLSQHEPATPPPKPLVARTPSPAKKAPTVRSTRPLTKPQFELPGEAISRKKREEREARLKAQEEEERRRRQFKAKPIRSSVVPSSYPRETATSRARQSKAASSDLPAMATMPPSTSKRHPTGVTPATLRPLMSSTLAVMPRGRASIGGSSISSNELRRTTSSMSGSSKRSSLHVSSEEAAQQKQRACDILSRDSSVAGQRERERRDRESAFLHARREAAEQSRKLSREWAEKQKLKKAGTSSLRMSSGAVGQKAQ